ncbi:MAG: hypothetical protein ACJAU6_001791 [Alphaproteobacteria bacterium]|jgi:hypothetical protein
MKLLLVTPQQFRDQAAIGGVAAEIHAFERSPMHNAVKVPGQTPRQIDNPTRGFGVKRNAGIRIVRGLFRHIQRAAASGLVAL